ncbi:MAG: diguanylate cyclase [Eubacterium sp.]|nr:diguanylate cyclase [Eubacterium sp.]
MSDSKNEYIKNNSETDPASCEHCMTDLEADMRRRLVRVMVILVVSCTVVDTGFFVYYFCTDSLSATVPVYILKRVLLPLVISLTAFLIARAYDRGNHPAVRKDVVCAFALETIAGAMTIFHSFFTPVWCGPAAATIVGMTFHNRRLSRALLLYGYVLTLVAMCWVIMEHPDDYSYYIQTELVVLVMNTLFYVTGVVVQSFNERVVEQTRDMLITQQQYREQLHYDALTGVYSRRYLMERAAEHMSRCDSAHPVSVAIIDIDNFKSVNDTYGHENGDVVLRRLGRLLQLAISDEVTVGRFGGEEFVFVIESENEQEHLALVEGIREEFSHETYRFMERQTTFSCGFITCREKQDFDGVLERADKALYQSKNNGKNRVTVYE